jgi:hypothetical protein
VFEEAMFNSKGANKNIFNVNYYWALSLKKPFNIVFFIQHWLKGIYL